MIRAVLISVLKKPQLHISLPMIVFNIKNLWSLYGHFPIKLLMIELGKSCKLKFSVIFWFNFGYFWPRVIFLVIFSDFWVSSEISSQRSFTWNLIFFQSPFFRWYWSYLGHSWLILHHLLVIFSPNFGHLLMIFRSNFEYCINFGLLEVKF